MTYRFPTEAEWEYACRAGQEEPYGTDERLHTYIDRHTIRPTCVGQSGPNPWGLYDLGWWWEPCQSYFLPYPATADEGREDMRADWHQRSYWLHVVRGGNGQCAFRGYTPPLSSAPPLALRLVCALEPYVP